MCALRFRDEFDADFDAFWAAFPVRVGKLAARRAYDSVRAAGTTSADLLDGVARYVVSKPAYAEWCHPRTWLTQGRWLDDPSPIGANERLFAAELRRRVYGGCPHDPRCDGADECIDRIAVARRGDVELT